MICPRTRPDAGGAPTRPHTVSFFIPFRLAFTPCGSAWPVRRTKLVLLTYDTLDRENQREGSSPGGPRQKKKE